MSDQRGRWGGEMGTPVTASYVPACVRGRYPRGTPQLFQHEVTQNIAFQDGKVSHSEEKVVRCSCLESWRQCVRCPDQVKEK